MASLLNFGSQSTTPFQQQLQRVNSPPVTPHTGPALNLTHNPVTNFIGGHIVKPIAQVGQEFAQAPGNFANSVLHPSTILAKNPAPLMIKNPQGRMVVNPDVSRAVLGVTNGIGEAGIGDRAPSPPLSSTQPLKINSTPEALTLGTGQGSDLKANKFIGTIKKSNEVSAPVKEQVQSMYKAGTNAQKIATSQAKVSGGLSKATELVNGSLSKQLGSISPQEVSDAIAVAKAHDSAGNTQTATDIYNKVAKHLTSAGQTVQAGALLASRTPEGLRNAALDDLKKGGANITPDLTSQVGRAYQAIKSAAPGSNEHAFAIQDLQKIINDNVKQSKLDQGFTLWRTGLLTGPLTASKVGISHLVMNAAEKMKDIPAVALDKSISLFTGVRSTALTGRGTLSGASEGLAAAKTLLGSGHDTPGTSAWGGTYDELGRPRVSFGTSKLGKVANFYTQKVGGMHAAIPKPFYSSAYANDLYKQADAAASTKGLAGDAKDQFIQKSVASPSSTADAQAHHAAQHATFQQPTFLGKLAAAFQKVPGGRVLTPFAHIASAILTDVKDYSPVGAMQSVYQAAKNSKSGWTPQIQKQLVEGVGRGVTGTGVVALGAELFKQGKITTEYPTDKKEQALWKAEGKQPNSILVNGNWRQTPALGPFGSLLAAGALYQSSKGINVKGKSNVTAALMGALSNVSSQSFLSGLTQGGAAIQNPTENLNSFAKLEAGSLVPVGVGQVAAANDKNVRTVNTSLDAIKSKIPGIRESLPASQDVFGRPVLNSDRGITGLLDPSRPTNAVNDPAVNELQRLVNTTGTSGVPVPSAPTKLSGIGPNGGKLSIPLTKAQQNSFTTVAGPQIKNALGQTINSPGYTQLSDDSKNSALTTTKNTVENNIKAQVFNSLSKGSGINSNIKASAPSNAIDKAQIAADKASFATSGENIQIKDGVVFQKNTAGNVTTTPKASYDYSVGTTALASQKKVGDVTGYLGTAQSQLANISSQLKDPNTTPATAKKLASDAASLQSDIAKYSQYGGFTKPTGAATYQNIGSLTGANSNYVSAITQAAPKYNVDINAALAVAAVEGLGGGVGDNGTSFGPFQLHVGGALPAGKTQAWAESPAGIDYALQKIGSVAGGKTGQAAIQAIVNSFERPANPSAEIANALSIYNGGKATLTANSPRTTSITASTSGSSSSTKLPKIPNFKVASSKIKAPKVGKISVRGSRSYKAPKLAKSSGGISKLAVRSSKAKTPKLPVTSIPKIPKVA